jgi:hypothetical protein
VPDPAAVSELHQANIFNNSLNNNEKTPPTRNTPTLKQTMLSTMYCTLLVLVAALMMAEADLHRGAIFGFGGGDPHVTTFSGERFEFHRQGDFVLLSNPDFADGLGLDIHVKSKLSDWWSYIEAAVVRMGDETIEVRGGQDYSQYWINGEEGFSALQPGEEMQVWLKQGGLAVHIRQVNSKQFQVRIDLGNDEGILIETFREFVRVDIQANDDAEHGSFVNSSGLIGSFPDGTNVAATRPLRIQRTLQKYGKYYIRRIEFFSPRQGRLLRLSFVSYKQCTPWLAR